MTLFSIVPNFYECRNKVKKQTTWRLNRYLCYLVRRTSYKLQCTGTESATDLQQATALSTTLPAMPIDKLVVEHNK